MIVAEIEAITNCHCKKTQHLQNVSAHGQQQRAIQTPNATVARPPTTMKMMVPTGQYEYTR